MSCRQFVELVTEYLEGSLSWRERRRFEKHLKACPWCTRYLDQMKVTLRTVGRIEPEAISPEARETLLHAFRDWNAERQAS